MRTLDRESPAGRVSSAQIRHGQPVRWTHGVRESLFVALLYLGYTASRLLAAQDPAAAAHRARRLHDFEAAWGVNGEHAVVRLVAHHQAVGLLSCYWYSTAHYLVTPLVLVWLYRRSRHAYLPARRALIMATVVGLVMYLLLPTAPPRLVGGYQDVLSLHASAGWWGADASAPRGMGRLTNELAAFPSLHAGWSLWVALVTRRWARRRSVRIAGWLYAILTGIVVVGTANHWLLDVLAGWLVTLLGWGLTASTQRLTPPGGAMRSELTCLLHQVLPTQGAVDGACDDLCVRP